MTCEPCHWKLCLKIFVFVIPRPQAAEYNFIIVDIIPKQGLAGQQQKSYALKTATPIEDLDSILVLR